MNSVQIKVEPGYDVQLFRLSDEIWEEYLFSKVERVVLR